MPGKSQLSTSDAPSFFFLVVGEGGGRGGGGCARRIHCLFSDGMFALGLDAGTSCILSFLAFVLLIPKFVIPLKGHS